MEATFILSAAAVTQFPKTNLPEVCFAGRSNVGKSSMINKILNRKKLVKVGNTPGKTRLINFFNIDDKLILTDLPGYGYAKVSKSEREAWGRLIEAYFNKRENLAICVLLLDARRVPNNDDIHMINAMQSLGIRTFCIITKADKLSRNQLNNQLRIISTTLAISISELIPFSAVTGLNVSRIWEIINETISGS